MDFQKQRSSKFICRVGVKSIIVILFSTCTLSCFAQFDKSITYRATANFNAVLNGLATNDAGIGVGLDASLFSKYRLQALIETSAERFIGDKLLITDSTGKPAKSAAVYSVKAGPQFFLSKNLALSVTYGPVWYVLREFKYSMDYGLKYSITGFLGVQRRFVTKVFMVNIPTSEQKIQYLGLAGGYRF